MKMGQNNEEYNPKDRVIYLKCPHILLQDITLCEIRNSGENPKYILVPKGTVVTLEDDRIVPCRTKEGGRSSGSLYKITETRGVEIEDRFIGRTVVIPDMYVDVREDVL